MKLYVTLMFSLLIFSFFMQKTTTLKQVKIIDDSPLFDYSSEIYDVEDLSESKKLEKNLNFRFKEKEIDNVNDYNNILQIKSLNQYIQDNQQLFSQKIHTKPNFQKKINNQNEASRRTYIEVINPNEIINSNILQKNIEYLTKSTKQSFNHYGNDENGNILQLSFCEDIVDKNCTIIRFISKM